MVEKKPVKKSVKKPGKKSVKKPARKPVNKTVKIKWDAPTHFVEHDINPLPKATHSDVGMLRARDGALLRNAVFMCAKPRGTVVLMTGYSEYIEKYFETIGDLLAMGFAVVMPEWRGHGLSDGFGDEPTRLHLSDFDINLRDLEDRWDTLLADMPKPHFGLAHSMGGQISLRAAQAHPDWFTGLAQCAPMHGLPIPRHMTLVLSLVIAVAKLFGKTDQWNPGQPPAVRPGKAEDNRVTHDFDRFNRGETLYVTEPQLQVNGASLGWFAAAMKTMAQTRRRRFLKSIATPLYIGTAGDEMLVDNTAHTHVLKNVQNGRGDVYDGARHELLMEKDATRQKFLKNVSAFFDALL